MIKPVGTKPVIKTTVDTESSDKQWSPSNRSQSSVTEPALSKQKVIYPVLAESVELNPAVIKPVVA